MSGGGGGIARAGGWGGERASEHRAHHRHVDFAAAGDDAVRQRRPPAAAAVGFADDDLRHVALAGHLQQGCRDVFTGSVNHLGAEAARQAQPAGEQLLLLAGKRLGPFHPHRQPRAAMAARGAPRPADQAFRIRGGPHAHQQAGIGFPRAADPAGPADVLQIAVDALGGEAQCELPQGGQIAFAKEPLSRRLGPLAQIDLALGQPQQQLLDAQIDELDFVRTVEEGIRHGFAHRHPGDLTHDVDLALDMLDVEGGADVDA